MNITEGTPTEIDTEIARLSVEVFNLKGRVERIVHSVLDYSGLRSYVPATWGGKSHYKVTGTFQEGVEKLREYEAAYDAYRASDYDQALYPKPLSNYAGSLNVQEVFIEKVALESQISSLYKLLADLETEYFARGGWTRMFMVTSSNGHIHATTLCHTTKLTTTFGWMPEYSGLNEAELLAKLGVYAESACTVCYKGAPVIGKGKKVTVAKANKMIAGPVLNAG